MAILTPDHFFEQAEKLAAAPQAGAPRQVDLRRAISSAYYGIFHFVSAELADEVVGSSKRNTPHYGLVYRSINHQPLKDICNDLAKQTPPQRYVPYLPNGGIGPSIQAFATALVELQEKRHRADYNPTARFRTRDALLAVTTGRRAIARFSNASKTRRSTFLLMLLCPPRT